MCTTCSGGTPASVSMPRTMLTTMLDRLSSAEFPALAGLTVRTPDDFAIALLDAWATTADVLSFYGDRAIAEFFLSTATQRRSLTELARLVGYTPRPGVAASTHLAFTMEVGGNAVVPAGSRVQNVPVQGQLPQSYETSAALDGRERFNRLGLRKKAPQRITATSSSLWLRGTATALSPGDGVVLDIAGTRTFRLIQALDVDRDGDRTLLWLDRRPAPAAPAPAIAWPKIRDALTLGASAPQRRSQVRTQLPPAGPVGVVRDTDIRQAALGDPAIIAQLYRALSEVTATDPPEITVYAMRVRAKVFGHNAARKPIYFTRNSIPEDPSLWIDWDESQNYPPGRVSEPGPAVPLPEDERLVHLDRVYDGIQDGSITVVVRPGETPPLVLDGTDATASNTNRAEYGLTGPCTVLDLGVEGDQDRSWWPSALEESGTRQPSMAELRATVVHTAAEPLPLADEPVTGDVDGTLLELDGVYEGLAAGRLLALTGERSDLGIPGVRTTEIVRVGAVDHVAAGTEDDVRAGERNHTLLTLDAALAGTYLRATVILAGNVVEATHGETKAEVLGSGDASIPRQRFPLRSSPLTHVSAATPTGAVPALELRVDDVLWPLRDTPVGLRPDDRGYLLRLAEDRTATVVGLDGVRGRRFPSGTENLRARYRVGIGRPGNVDAETITLLATKPLGVAGVTNPVPATGGADPESGDDIRRNVAVPLKALDRLVSVPDYADFARAFAGIGKSSADRLVVRGREEIVVTVAGVDDAPIADGSALRRNLLAALRTFGDPLIGVRVLVRERLVMRLALTVTIDADRDWAVVAPQVRAALAAAFSFDGRELGCSVAGSEVLAAAHRVPGVRRCVITELTTEPPPPPPPPPPPTAPPVHPGPRLVVLAARSDADGAHPAQLAYLAPDLPEFLVLTQGGLS